MKIQDIFQNKNVLIFGLGLQGGGVSSAKFAKKHGAKVKLTDKKPPKALKKSLSKLPPEISQTLSLHSKKNIQWADIILKNPAIPKDNKFIQYARSKNKKVLMSDALFLKYTKLKTIAVTGTRGKSTTTHLIYQILKKAFPNQVLLGGNLPEKSALNLLDQEQGKKLAVLELSSFQLSGCHDLKVSPNIAVVTNIYPDHLDYYQTLSAYIQDKTAILSYQTETDHAVLNKNNPEVKKLAQETSVNVHWFTKTNLNTPLPGEHNQENVAAAQEVAKILDVSEKTIHTTIQSFTGLPYRLEMVGEYKGISYINDTTSTTPTATIKAIKSVSSNIILILGGAEKNLPLEKLAQTICQESKVKAVVTLSSQSNSRLQSQLSPCKEKLKARTQSMPEAVKSATQLAQRGDTVLLSPGFASFDLFKNEFDRGKKFNQEVKKLAQND